MINRGPLAALHRPARSIAWATSLIQRGASWKVPLPLLDGHDYSKVIGTVQTLKRTPEGIAFSARVAKVDTPATLRDRIDEVWTLIRQRLLANVSIGFRPSAWRPRENGEGMVFESFEILELSVVAVPACSSAIIESVAEAAEFSDLQRALANEPEWLKQEMAAIRARFHAGRRASGWKPDVVVRLANKK
ncbi:HK97 family phage prohead protease [Paraburkholderia atlantica]|uniref:HK97 family phage prohead protease n=1 Tax=Paraburkholderia atlantica TaxID=2654982 RepID=UPI003D19FA49